MDWTAPGVEEVAPGVHRIPLPMPNDGLRAVNVYAVLAPGAVALVDGGWRAAGAASALDQGLRTLGLRTDDVDRCIVTHHHRDHYTLGVDLRRRAGLELALGDGERASLEALRDLGADPLRSHVARLLRAGAGPVVEAVRQATPETVDLSDYEDPDVWLVDGAEVLVGQRRLRTVSTPGHTRGHVVYVDDAAGLMFSGDHVLPHITPSIGFEAAPVASPLADYLNSLARVLTEPDRTMLPAHGPAGGSVHARTQALLRHHEERLAESESAAAAGAGTAYEVAQALRWTRRGRRLADLDVFNQMLAVLETMAHLDVLVVQGRLRLGFNDQTAVFTR